MTIRCDFRTDISVHGLCDRNMRLYPASNRHFTVSPARGVHVLPAAGSHCISLFTSWEKVEFTRSLSLFFCEFVKVTIAGPSSNSSIGMENNELYGISAVKVKLVDSLI